MAARSFLIAGAGIGVGALATWASWFEPRRLVVRELEVSVDCWPDRLSGLTIGVVADLHVGSPHVDPARLEQIVERVNDLSADLICLLGDYLTLDMFLGRRVRPCTACEPLGQLHPRLGVYAVLGDHDWELDATGVAASLAKAGVTVLEDEATPVGDAGLWVAGVSRTWRIGSDGYVALSAVPDGTPILALAHSPDVFPSLPDDVALTLAGHTHGGQVRVPALTRRMVPSRFGARYLAGLYRDGVKQLFVHTGVGTSRLPIRFLVPPQITLLTIRSGGS